MNMLKCKGLALLAVACICLVATSAAWAENKRVNCRKYLFAPVCRGSVKRSYYPSSVNMNRMDYVTIEIPKQILYDAKWMALKNDPRHKWESFDDKNMRIMKGVYNWIMQNRRIVYGEE